MSEIEENQKLAKTEKSFLGFFIEKIQVSWLILICIIVLGVSSFNNLPREIQPEINIPFVSVATFLPGSSPTDVEILITDKLEKEIGGINGIKNLNSLSAFGISSIFIEFEANGDLDESFQEVKEAVDRAKSELPEDTLEPMVQKAQANSFAVITFSITGELPIYELSKIAEKAKEELENASSIATARILGKQEKIIEIKLDSKKLTSYQLNIDQIANLVKASNFNLPIGLVSIDKLNYALRIDNRFKSIEEIQNIPILNLENKITDNLILKDIATVSETLTALNVISKVSQDGKTAFPAVSIQIYKKDNSDIVQAVTEAKAIIENLAKNKTISDEAKIIITNDNSQFIEEELGNLTSNGIQTAIFIIITLFLGLGLTQGIIAGLSIPLTFLMTFPILEMLGLSFNTLSLFSLVISLGITIDTSVVIMEGIYEKMQKGATSKEAALLSIKMYKWPLIAGTATNIFAFFPLLLVSGILGEFLRTMPITITATLVTSLLLSLTVIPAITSKLMKKEATKEKQSILAPLFKKLGMKFESWIKEILSKKTYRVGTILISIVAFFASISLPLSGLLTVEMFPQTDQNYFNLSIEKPVGTIIQETSKAVESVETFLYQIPEVQNFISNIGTTQSVSITEDSALGVNQSLSESHLANITVNLIPKEDREIKSFEIAQKVREKFAKSTEAKILVEEISEGPPSEDPLTVRLTGNDLEKLKELANEVKDIIEKTPQTNNAKMSLTPGQNEFQFTLDKEKIALYRITVAQVAATVRNNILGSKATTISNEGDDLDVYLKYDFEDQSLTPNISFEEIKNLPITNFQGNNISLSDIAELSLEKSPAFIEREDQQRIIKVTSGIETDADIVTINEKVQAEIAKLELPDGYVITFGGDLEEINESFRELFSSMSIGILLIAFCLVLMFNSFRQPLIILFTLPLALIGVFPGLYLIGLKLSFPAFLGVVSLGGIVVSNTIVLIDRINENRKTSMPFNEAIAEAANSRLGPIIMTSLSTILGVIPLAFGNPFWAGLGFTIAFGQIFSTVLLLLVIPVIYYSFEIGREKKRTGI